MTDAPGIPDRYTIGPDMQIDELVLHDAYVHLEALGGGDYMLICENERGHFHLNVGRARPYEITIGGELTDGETPWEEQRDD